MRMRVGGRETHHLPNVCRSWLDTQVHHVPRVVQDAMSWVSRDESAVSVLSSLVAEDLLFVVVNNCIGCGILSDNSNALAEYQSRGRDQHDGGVDMTSIPVSPPAVKPRFRAIPTEYRGIRFRSRSEARWAVFFDSLSVPWCYEEEGYELPDGTLYLPDFYIPRWDTTIEIKGAAEPDERIKCAVLSDCLQRRVLLLEGFPYQDSYFGYCYRPGPEELCGRLNCLFAEDRKDDGVYWLIGNDGECACMLDRPRSDHDKYPLPDNVSHTIPTAYESARSYWKDYRSGR